jgi:hypothetical protein
LRLHAGRLRCLAVFAVWCWAGSASVVFAASHAPAKVAVFAFELVDFSAAVEHGTSPVETAYLAQSTEEARKQLLQSGRYSIVTTDGADVGTAKGQGLRNCGGCEAGIAMKLGADQALIGVVTKISMTEYTLQMQIRDARTGAVIMSAKSGLRIGADYSWSRGVRWLMQNRILAAG